MIAEAQGEHERLITETEVYRTAVARADELGEQSHAEVAQMRAEVDDYVDTKLSKVHSRNPRPITIPFSVWLMIGPTSSRSGGTGPSGR